jgi:hypothetical protein
MQRTDAALIRQRFDARKVSEAKLVTPTEQLLEPGTAPQHGGDFNGITRPSDGLSLRGWPDISSAQAGIADTLGRHRVVQIICDYSMFARTEAPQQFPPP